MPDGPAGNSIDAREPSTASTASAASKPAVVRSHSGVSIRLGASSNIAASDLPHGREATADMGLLIRGASTIEALTSGLLPAGWGINLVTSSE